MKTYLGNGVYVELIDNVIVIYTIEQTIYLEQEVFSALIRWIEGLKE